MTQQINLFNASFRKQKKIFTTMTMLPALLLLVIGCMALSYYGKRSLARLDLEATTTAAQYAEKQKHLTSVMAEFVPRQKNKELESRIATAEAELKTLREVAAVLQRGEFGNTQGYSEYFKAFARQNVSGLWITGASIIGAGAEIGISGKALQAGLIPGYIAQLAREPVLRGKTFDSLEINDGSPADTGKDRPRELAKDAAPGAKVPVPVVAFTLQSSISDPDAAATAGAPEK